MMETFKHRSCGAGRAELTSATQVAYLQAIAAESLGDEVPLCCLARQLHSTFQKGLEWTQLVATMPV